MPGTACRLRLCDEIDALLAHLYGLSRTEYAHILSIFPLVFPDSETGRKRLSEVLAPYDAQADTALPSPAGAQAVVQ